MSEIVLFPVVQLLTQRSPVAVLIPEDIGATAVPPFESRPGVIGWHSVRVCGKEIDFALLLPRIGLFVIEVKDWATTGQAMQKGIGWRKALRAAIADNPFVKGEGPSPKARRELLVHAQLTLSL